MTSAPAAPAPGEARGDIPQRVPRQPRWSHGYEFSLTTQQLDDVVAGRARTAEDFGSGPSVNVTLADVSPYRLLATIEVMLEERAAALAPPAASTGDARLRDEELRDAVVEAAVKCCLARRDFDAGRIDAVVLELARQDVHRAVDAYLAESPLASSPAEPKAGDESDVRKAAEALLACLDDAKLEGRGPPETSRTFDSGWGVVEAMDVLRAALRASALRAPPSERGDVEAVVSALPKIASLIDLTPDAVAGVREAFGLVSEFVFARRAAPEATRGEALGDDFPAADAERIRGGARKAIEGALRSAIDAHGPIRLADLGSATKRILGALRTAKRNVARSDGSDAKDGAR